MTKEQVIMGLRAIKGQLAGPQRAAVCNAIQAMTDKRDRDELDDALADLKRIHERWTARPDCEELANLHGEMLWRVLAFADATRETPAWTEGCRAVAMERAKQKRMWKHDDEHTRNELPLFAIAYILASLDDKRDDPTAFVPDGWEFKPRDKRSNLIRAAALICAEIDRCST